MYLSLLNMNVNEWMQIHNKMFYVKVQKTTSLKYLNITNHKGIIRLEWNFTLGTQCKDNFLKNQLNCFFFKKHSFTTSPQLFSFNINLKGKLLPNYIDGNMAYFSYEMYCRKINTSFLQSSEIYSKSSLTLCEIGKERCCSPFLNWSFSKIWCLVNK